MMIIEAEERHALLSYEKLIIIYIIAARKFCCIHLFIHRKEKLYFSVLTLEIALDEF